MAVATGDLAAHPKNQYWFRGYSGPDRVGAYGTLFTFFRFFSGMGVGMASLVSPEYIAEVSPTAMRGRLTSLQQLGIVVGILVAFLVDYWITLASGGVNNPFWFGLAAWRCKFLTEAIPALVYIVASLFVSESPRFLVANKRDQEALAVAVTAQWLANWLVTVTFPSILNRGDPQSPMLSTRSLRPSRSTL